MAEEWLVGVKWDLYLFLLLAGQVLIGIVEGLVPSAVWREKEQAVRISSFPSGCRWQR